MNGKQKLVSVRIPEEMWDRLETARRNMGERSVSDVIRIAVDVHLAMLGIKEPAQQHPRSDQENGL